MSERGTGQIVVPDGYKWIALIDLDPGHADGDDRRVDHADLPAGHLPRHQHRPASAGQQLLPAVDDPGVPGGHERAGDHAGTAGRIYGRVRMYNLGFAVFTFFSLLLTVTWTPGTRRGST